MEYFQELEKTMQYRQGLQELDIEKLALGFIIGYDKEQQDELFLGTNEGRF